MSSLPIVSKASIIFSGFPDFASVIILPKEAGMTCHDTPNRSVSQPHGPSLPPRESVAQTWSSSFWVLQVATN